MLVNSGEWNSFDSSSGVHGSHRVRRLDYAYNLQYEAYFLGSYEPMLIKHPPSHCLKMMYLESTCYHPPAARCACDTVGPDHFIFGTDAPPLKPLKKQGVEIIKKIGLSQADENKVYCENAKRLLKLRDDVSAGPPVL